MSDLSKRLADLSPEKRELVLKTLQKRHLISEKDKGRQTPPIISIPRDQTIPLSFAQERLWFLSQLEEASAVYNMPAALRLTGPLNITALERSINEIVRRHETLRTTFVTEDGRPVQVIAPTLSIPVPVTDLQQLPEVEQSAEVQRLVDEEVHHSFDLSRGPLLRVTLLRLAEEEYVLLVTMHHIVSDGWSLGVFIREVAILYKAFLTGAASPLPELPIQYADFAQWQRNWLQGDVLEQHISYWKKQLSGDLPILDLPTDRPRPKRLTFQGTTQSFSLSERLSDAIKTLSQQEGVTLFMLLLSAFKTLLYRYTAQDDIIVGTAFANRNRAEIETLIGFFVNTLVLRTNLSGNPTFRELLRQVREIDLGAQAHQDMPFERLVTELRPERELSRQPLFQVMFVLENAPMQALELPGLTLIPMETYTKTAKFDLTLVMADTEQGLRGILEYNTDLFDDATITRMIGHFRTLLEAIVTDPEQRVAELPILTEAERHQILVEWNDTTTDYPGDTCIHELFEAQVKRTPDAVAVVFDEERMTYQELNQKANQLAHYLQKLGVGPEVLVGICIERSLDMIVGLLAVLKAGGVYMPLDPMYPKERLAFMFEDSQISMLLTWKTLIPELPAQHIRLVCLDTDWKAISQESVENPDSQVIPENAAYVIYTSGSTGDPKGVLVAHRGLCNLIAAQIRVFDVQPNSQVLQFVSFSFDVATSDIFITLCSGAVLYLSFRESLLPGPELIRMLRDLAITHIEIPASVLEALPFERLPTLRAIITGGEACASDVAVQWAAGRRFFNAYGPTETTVCATIAEYIDGYRKLPIGRPIANTYIYILDRHLQPVPIGVPGELHIGGVGLARGYLNRPEITAEKFIPSPFSDKPDARLYKTGDVARYLPDGNIEFLGRTDYQVKIRGFRVELGEIEAILGKHPAIRETVVIDREDVSGNKRLIAYVVTHQEQVIPVSELRDFLRNRLPNYMVPTTFMFLNTLPLTPTGKIDRRALPNPNIDRSGLAESFVAPRNPIEEVLVNIWAEVLGLERVGIYDNFFELGGHSLLAIKLIFRVSEVFQVELPLRNFFESPTVADFARIIEAVRGVTSLAALSSTSAIDFDAEATLASDIYPDSEIISDITIVEPSAIFLTGATGFLGAFLLDELLQQTHADIYCLVRSSNIEEGRKRIRDNLESYHPWDERLDSRIIPIPGDLVQPFLGLSTEEFNTIARQVDIIYHNGAMVNLIYPYSALKPANVSGTQEILRLASHIKVKPVHYVSTMSVFLTAGFSKKRTVYEHTPLDPFEELINEGYAQSKWIAEKLIESARSRGIPTTIYRAGTISGHSQTGFWNVNDVACKLIKGCIQLGKAPYKNVVMVYLTPVDYVSKAIIHLSRQKESWGQVFHLVNPHPMYWNDLVDRVYSFGYPIQRTSYHQWQRELISLVKADLQDNALYALLPIYLETEPESYEPQKFDCQNTLAGLAGTSIVCPPPKTLLHIYFSYFIRSGFLDPPSQTGR